MKMLSMVCDQTIHASTERCLLIDEKWNLFSCVEPWDHLGLRVGFSESSQV